MTNPTPGIPPTIHLRFIRGTEADIAAAAAASQFDTGEPIWATDTRRLYVASAPNTISMIGPATALPLTEYFHLPSNNIAVGNNIFEGTSSFKGDVSLAVTVTGNGTVSRWPVITPSSSSSSALLSTTDSSNKLVTTEWVKRYLTSGDLPERIAIKDRVNIFTEDNTFTSNVTFSDPIAVNDGGGYRGVNDFTNGQILVPLQSVTGPFDSKAASTQFVRDYVQQVAFGTGMYAKLASSNTYSGSIINDFSATSSLLGPSISTSWSEIGPDDSRVPTLSWLKANIPVGPNLLSTNNTWTGSNSWVGDALFAKSPAISQALPLTDNSNKVPTTSWVRNLVNTQMGMGNGPVVSKSPASADSIEWTSGTVIIGGSSYSVSPGSYKYMGPDGTFYVVAVRGSGTAVTVESNRTVVPTSPDETLLATVSVIDKGLGSFPRYEVAGVSNATTNFTEYARRNEDNTFTKKNTFLDEVNIQLSPGNVPNGATFGRTAIDFYSQQINAHGLFSIDGKGVGNYLIGPGDSNNKTLATTEWVTSKLGDAASYFTINSSGNVVFKSNVTGCLDLTNSCIYAPHPSSLTASDNRVPTTKWVQDLISGRPSTPVVSAGPGLSIVWTGGVVEIPDTMLCSKRGAPASGDAHDDHDDHHHHHHHYYHDHHHHHYDHDHHDEAGGSSLPPCLNYETCNVPASVSPMPVTPGMRYVYVRYSDCAVVVSFNKPDENYEGQIIAELSVGSTVNVTPRLMGGWAPLNSPAFVGSPTAPKPPDDVCDDRLATTGWVCDRLHDLLHKPCSGMNLPRVYRVGTSFQVNITSGQVPKPQSMGGGYCEVSTLSSPVSVVIGQTEYHWVRYRDCRFVVSSSVPDPETEGYLLATSRTTSSEVLITLVSQAVQHTAFTKNYVVGFGGNLIYVGPEEC